MKIQKTNLAQILAVGVAVAASTVVMPASAADLDFSTMTGAIAATAVVAAIVSMGVVKISPNFARWAVNKVAGFFR